MNSTQLMNRAADNIRILAAAAVEKAKSGHPGGSMGGADFINVLYTEFLEYDPENPTWEGRDRLFLDPGHMSPMLYAALTLAGKYTIADLQDLRQWGSVTPGHPERNVERGIENTSGPLGQGHTFAVGAAIAAKFFRARFGEVMKQTIYAFISDGGIQEEISQGAGRIAGHLGLDNLIMFYDSNEVQLSTMCDEVTGEDVAKKYEAWNWYVQTINGNDPDAIREAIRKAKAETERPSLIIGNTIMGKGCLTEAGENFEGQCSTHGQPLSKSGASIEATIRNLGGDPANPFVIFPEVQALYDAREAELKEIANQRYVELYEWKQANPALAAQYDQYFTEELPELDWNIAQKPNVATRTASAACLGMLAEKVGNMVVSSADLCNSDKTDGFLKKTHAFAKGDFTGAFLQAGVSELTMTCVMMGMALHGGIIPACGTFFVFSDYMKPAIRMAALMEIPIKFVWSHDAFRVGEDGPTHEPVEQEAQIRLMEKLKNHKGKNSVLVLRPADADETTFAWRMAMENMDTPTALILSRQDVPSLATLTPQAASLTWETFQKGAYIVSRDENPQVVLLASGSEVSTLLAGAELLRAEGIRLQIVSVPSEGLFRQQSKEYQNEILPQGIVRFGMTAGLPVTLEGLVGENGKVWGLDSFGFSAPYKVLDEKLGFTAENVYNQVKALL